MKVHYYFLLEVMTLRLNYMVAAVLIACVYQLRELGNSNHPPNRTVKKRKYFVLEGILWKILFICLYFLLLYLIALPTDLL